jgi:hypothetical protein
MKLSFDDEESFKEAVESLRFNNPASNSNSEALAGSDYDAPGEEDEVNNSQTDQKSLGRVGSVQERSEDIEIKPEAA